MLSSVQALELFNTSPALFVENQGQWADESIRYAHSGNGVNVGMTDTGIDFQLIRSEPATSTEPVDPALEPLEPLSGTTSMLAFSASFVGANVVAPIGLDQSETLFNYFVGEQSDWHSDVPAYEKVGYSEPYAGIDVVTWGLRSHLKYEFHVAPGADYQQIQVHYDGIAGLSIAEDGSLVVDLGTDWGQFVDSAPYVYQDIDGQTVEVAGRFVLLDATTYSFEITGPFDSGRELVIDPNLDWSTYLGGSGNDNGSGVAVDAAGNALVTGETGSSGWVSGGFDTSYNGSFADAFVVKLSPTGGHIWSTYLGGSGPDRGWGIAVDASGNALVTGDTQSSGWVSRGFDTSLNGEWDAFVVKLSPAGAHVWSTYLGGSGHEIGFGIAVDASGNALVTGETGSPGWVSGGFDTSVIGGVDAFVAKLSSTGGHIWSTYLGGSSNDNGSGVAVDAAGNALVTGETGSSGWVSGGFDTSYNGSFADAFVVKLSPTGGHIWSTYLGGFSGDNGNAIAVDGSGNALVTGYTQSSGWVSGGFDTNYSSGADGFVVKVSATGGHLWSTYLGGNSSDWGLGIAVDAAGNALVTGPTSSSGWVSGGFDTIYNLHDGFVVKLSPTGGHLWSTYLGASGEDSGSDIAVDASRNIWVTGSTSSSGWVSGGFDTNYSGGRDGFVARISDPNVAPIAGNNSYSTNEDVPLSVAAPGVLSNDTDADGNPLTAILVSAPAMALAFNLNSDGSFTYTPAANFNGSDSFTYRASDGQANSNVATVSITVNSVNDAPSFAMGGDVTVAEDSGAYSAAQATSIDDGDAEVSQTLTFNVSNDNNALFSVQPSLSSTGVLTFTPAANANGSALVTASLTDDATAGGAAITTAIQTFTINVNSVNDAPLAADDSNATDEDTPLAGTSVLANDSDLHGGAPIENNTPLTAQLVSGPANAAAFTLNADGTFSYTPSANFNGSDSFTYQALDSLGGVSSTATVSITVNSVNDAPAATGDSYTTDEDTTLNGTSVLANDSDLHGGAPGENNTPLTAQLVAGPSNAASFTLNADGTFSYTPSANFNGSDSFTYRAIDSLGGVSSTATVSITVNSVNDAPSFSVGGDVTVAEDSGAYSAAQATSVDDGDPEVSQTLTFNVLNDNNALFSVQPSLSSTGLLTFTPAANANGSTLVTVSLTDDATAGGAAITTANQTFTINVNSVNDAPVAADDSYTTEEDVTLMGSSVLANDSDLHGGAPNENNTPLTAQLVSGPVNAAAFTLNADGTFSYSPSANFNGSDSFTYQAVDSLGGVSSTATVSITVNSVNDAPVAQNVSANANEDGPAVTGSFDADDVDSDDVPSTLMYSITTSPSEGSVVNNNDGTFTFDPGSDFHDLAVGETRQVAFAYTATDSHGAVSNTATVTITVSGENDATSVGGADISIDAVNEGDTASLTESYFDIDASDDVVITASVGNVSKTGTNSGTWSWSFDTSDGPDDSQTVTITFDDSTETVLVQFQLTVNNVVPDFEAGPDETLPPAVAGEFSRTGISFTDPGAETWTGTVNYGDSLVDEPLTINQSTKSFDVSHTFTTERTFVVTVTVNDGDVGGTRSDTFEVTVILNEPPVIEDQSFDVVENESAVGSLVASDPDLPDDTLTYSISGGPDAELFTIDGSTGALSFVDAPDFETTLDSGGDNVYDLEIIVTDSKGESDAANVSVSVLNQASITAVVFVDVNENGLYDANEPGIDGVLVELLNELGAPVLDDLGAPITATTSNGGVYLFEDLDPETYQLHELQPTGVDDGAELLGSLGDDAHTVVANDVMQLTLQRTDAFDYAFAEIGQQVAVGDTATIGFWQNKHGQALIAAGGSNLANWLTTNFGNVFGNSLDGGTGQDVADFYRNQLFKQKAKKSAGPAKVDAQFMAVALATYFTSSNLAGTVASSYGFNVTDTGIGTKVVNVGFTGAAFNVADGTDLTIMQILLATDSLTDQPNDLAGFAYIYDQNGDGVIDSEEAALRALANELYTSINEGGAG